ncbi:MAG: MFS transporter [Phycisphaerales bacterium]
MTTRAPARSTGRTVVAGIAGNVLEWYDFAVYGFFAPIIASQFFPSDDPTVSLIATFGAFAAGFFMRPVGAAVFGHVGDRFGRRAALMLSVMLMAVPTFLIGLLPGYATLGVAASILMVLLRMAQGMAVGGEFTSSIVYLAEQSPGHNRGFLASWSLFGAVGGTLAGSLMGALLSAVLDQQALADWGWRLAFIAGLAVSITALLLRRGMEEDAPGRRDGASPIITAFRRHGGVMARVVALNVANAAAFYLIFVYSVTWLIDRVAEPRSTALEINVASMVVLLVLIPLCAHISDRVGRRAMLIVGYALLAIGAWPLLWLMHLGDPTLSLIGECGLAVVIAIYIAGIPAAMTEMFPPEVRVSAVSLAYNVTLAVFGGTAPMVAVWLIERTGDDLSFAWYLSGAALVSLAAAISWRPQTRP